jgi:glycerophosphoryl diester phosphodiesterase
MTTRPLLLGHRGARYLKSIPENTLESFDRALADGCDGFEFDVRLTADGEPVICHDPMTRNSFRGQAPGGNAQKIESKIGDMEIARVDAQQLFWLPRLQDVLERYRASAFLDIELKVSGIEKIIVRLLHGSNHRRGFVVSSFLPDVLTALRSQSSEIPLGLICETKTQLSQWRELPLEYVILRHNLLDKTLIHEIQTAGKKVLVWTVNKRSDMQLFTEWSVDGIISDHSKLLTQTVTR